MAEQHLRIVFFPLFPWLLRALNAFGVLPWYVLGCAVQLPLFSGCGTALYALAGVAGPVLGLLGYFLLNWAVFGDWLRFSEYQAQHWGQKLGFFWNTVAYHLDTMAQWWREGQRLNAVCISLLAVVCILYALGLLCAAARRLQAHHLAFALPGGLLCAALRGRAVLPQAALGVAVLAGGPGRRGGGLLCRLPAPRASVLTA